MHVEVYVFHPRFQSVKVVVGAPILSLDVIQLVHDFILNMLNIIDVRCQFISILIELFPTWCWYSFEYCTTGLPESPKSLALLHGPRSEQGRLQHPPSFPYWPHSPRMSGFPHFAFAALPNEEEWSLHGACKKTPPLIRNTNWYKNAQNKWSHQTNYQTWSCRDWKRSSNSSVIRQNHPKSCPHRMLPSKLGTS